MKFIKYFVILAALSFTFFSCKSSNTTTGDNSPELDVSKIPDKKASIFNADYVPPASKKEVGCVAGRIAVITDKTFWSLTADTYISNIYVGIKNKKTKQIYHSNSNRGYYYIYNLPVGEYDLEKWQIEFKVNDVTKYLNGYLKNISFKIEDKTFTTLKNITVKVEISKEFSYENKAKFFLKDEDLNNIKDYFTRNDLRGYWKDAAWKQSTMPDIKEEIQLTENEVVNNYVAASDNDYFSMESLYKQSDYYLSFLLFYRIVENLLKAQYVKNIDKNVFVTEDLRDLAKKANVKLTPDQMILLTDLNTFNQRIKNGEDDESFKAMFTQKYFENYLVKINNLRNEFKKTLKIQQ
jgi:hypothetical protein